MEQPDNIQLGPCIVYTLLSHSSNA